MTRDRREQSSDTSTPAFDVSLEVGIDGDIDRIFTAFSEPAEVSRWFTTRHEATVEVGGRYRNADGDHGRYLRVDPPHLVEFTWENAKHCPGTTVSVSFREAEEGRVVVALVHSRLASRSDAEDMRGGWSWALDSFRSYVDNGKPIPHEEWLRARG